MFNHRVAFVLLFAISRPAIGCDRCKCGFEPLDIYAAAKEEPYKWSLDTFFEYNKFDHISLERASGIIESGRDTHDHQDEIHVSERVGYSINKDVSVGLSQGYRHLRLTEIEDEEHLGDHETSSGATGLEFDFSYRIKEQAKKGLPVGLALFGSAKAPTGMKRGRKPFGELFETEDQPGSGAWEGTLGLATVKHWGDWNASGALSYTYKGEGSRQFKEGDILRLALSGSRLVSPKSWPCKLYAILGVQGVIENKAQEDGVKTPDHGGQSIFVIPGVTVRPLKRLQINLSASLPAYQEENGFHQRQNLGLQFGIGVRF